MLDDIHSDDGLRIDGRRARRSERERPLVDREVPLDRHVTGRVLAPAVHAWLDGELPEAAVRQGETQRDVDFWKALNEAAAERRHLRTPINLEQRIMAALPQTLPQVITPWYRREMVITPAAAVGAATALVAFAATVTAILFTLARH
jgi:hypothetical protein